MLAEPSFITEWSKDRAWVRLYTVFPILAYPADMPLVRFSDEGIVDALVLPADVYEIITHIPSLAPVTLAHMFSLMQLAGLSWRRVSYTARQLRYKAVIHEINMAHKIAKRTDWEGGRRTYVWRIFSLYVRYLWRPVRYAHLQRAIAFERQWLKLQQDVECVGYIERSHRYGSI